MEFEVVEVWFCGVVVGICGWCGGSCSGIVFYVYIGVNVNSGGCESDLGCYYFGVFRCWEGLMEKFGVLGKKGLE